MVRPARYWVYVCSPIDFWPGWRMLEQLFEEILNNEVSWQNEGVELLELAEEASIARNLVVQHGWEGDGTWMYSVLPDPEAADTSFLFAVKQENNGTTFLCSPFRLPYIAEAGSKEHERHPERPFHDKYVWLADWGLTEAYLEQHPMEEDEFEDDFEDD